MTLRLTAFGPPALVGDDGPVAPELLWRKHFALFVYLLRSPGGTRRRDHLVGLFWPNKSDAKARHSLNEACRGIRRGAGDAALRSGADTIALDPDCVVADWTALEAALAATDAARAAALWRGEFLESFGIPDASPFEDWLAAERLTWSSRLRGLLTVEADRCLAAGAVAPALAYAGRVLAADPSAEDALRLAMTCEALQGAAPAALQRFDGYVAWLAREHGAAPAPGLVSLAARLRGGERLADAAPVSAAPPPFCGRAAELSALVAVLPDARRIAANVAVVSGAPGIGRSRLVREAAERARLAGAAVVTVTCVAADADAPGAVLAALLRRGLAELPGLAAAPPEALATLAAFDGGLARRYPGVRPRTPSGASDVGRALGEALAAAAEDRPLLLAVDDAHLADDLTLDALASVLRAAERAPLTLLLAAPFGSDTPPSLTALRARIGSDLPGTDVTLGPLDDAVVALLVAALLPAYDDDARARLVRRLRREADGVPLYVVEIARALAAAASDAAATLWPRAGETTAQPLPFPVPGAVTAALTLRTGALPADVRATLLAAAVAGSRVDADLVAGMREQPTAVVDAHCADLEREGFLRHDGARYLFAVEVVRTFLASQMLAGGERRALHRRAAAGLLARGGGHDSLDLAEHLYGAGDWSAAAHTARAVEAAAAARKAPRLAARASRLARRADERVAAAQ